VHHVVGTDTDDLGAHLEEPLRLCCHGRRCGTVECCVSLWWKTKPVGAELLILLLSTRCFTRLGERFI
jgi:hypothetical protein